MRYHNRIACCDAFAILECGRINFPTCIAYPPNTAGDCDIVREMRFIHIGYVDGRHEPTHTFVTRMAAQRTMKADTPRFKQPGHGDVVHMPHDIQVLISRSEEQTSELQSLMRMSYAVFCSKTKEDIDRCHISSITADQLRTRL